MTVNDPYAPQTNIQQNLLSGTTIFQFQFVTANPTGWQITVSTISEVRLWPITPRRLLPVVPNTPTKIMVTVLGTSLVPGNVGAGGLSGSPNPETAGTTWLATATITDNYYNPVGNAGTGSLYFQTSDPYDVDGTTSTLSQGTTNFMVTMVTANNQSLSIYPDPSISIPQAPSPASRSSPPLWTGRLSCCREKSMCLANHRILPPMEEPAAKPRRTRPARGRRERRAECHGLCGRPLLEPDEFRGHRHLIGAERSQRPGHRNRHHGQRNHYLCGHPL